jgi:hypothetical protein
MTHLLLSSEIPGKASQQGCRDMSANAACADPFREPGLVMPAIGHSIVAAQI